MLEIIIFILLFCLCAIGLCDLLHGLWMIIVRPAVKTDKVCIAFLDGKNDYLILEELYEQYKWYGRKLCDRAYVVYKDYCDPDVLENFTRKGIQFIEYDLLNSGVLNERGTEGNHT